MVGLVVPNEALATVRLVPEKRGGGYLERKPKEAVKNQVQLLPFGLLPPPSDPISRCSPIPYTVYSPVPLPFPSTPPTYILSPFPLH